MIKSFFKDAGFGVSLLLIAAAIGLASIATPIFGNKALIVRSGSMQPTIGVGDLVVVTAQNSLLTPQSIPVKIYKEGDIIAFRDSNNPKILTTHRVVNTQVKDGKVFYQTKGDANNAADNNLVAEENIVGRAQFSIAAIGKLFAFVKTKNGFLTAVIIPALLVILFEITNIIKEVKKLKNTSEVSTNNSNFGILRILFPFILAIMFFQNSFAFFSDSGQSTNNVFSASQTFPHLLINEIGSHGDKKKEWVELFNPTSLPINLSGWKIADNFETDTLPSVTISAGGYAVIVASNTDVTVPSSAATVTLSDNDIGNGLHDPEDRVILKNPSDTTIDAVSYGTDTSIFNPAAPAAPANKSIARSPNGVDTDSAADWVVDSSPSIGGSN